MFSAAHYLDSTTPACGARRLARGARSARRHLCGPDLLRAVGLVSCEEPEGGNTYEGVILLHKQLCVAGTVPASRLARSTGFVPRRGVATLGVHTAGARR